MNEKSASEQIDDIIKQYGGWKGQTLAQIRAIITQAHPEILEEVKWKMKTRPEGLPVWSLDGMVCFAETWKDNIKLLFSKGARLKDSHGLFNARLQSKDLRAIELHEDTAIDAAKLSDLVQEAIEFNKQK
jgi:hypothetical protein